MSVQDPGRADPALSRVAERRFPPIELLLVGFGGAAGSLARYAAGLIVPGTIGTLVVNVFGAFLLGVLVEAVLRLTMIAPEAPVRVTRLRRWRLLLGTGVLGGFTTYSLLAADIAESLIAGRILEGIGYGVATIVGGGVASMLGIAVARGIVRRGESRVTE
ncbi:CrcB family protein [Leucobacter sp. CSA2]|uniref:Fluoride-specific ion channel FluC n=1 Tax=Leucobacter edaphi TaxID=2796472 RepID=A0A934QCR5_9MICO|nr:CrcB family protein [Leucobacter edaphi]MBK0421435.1 CrcB family protein [Leucobacter edaphi]